MRVVIPMAGEGTRFAREGYLPPKPIINVRGRPMLAWAVQNLPASDTDRFLFVVRKDHLDRFPEFAACISAIDAEVVTFSGATASPIHTLKAAVERLQSGEPVLVANVDQYLKSSIAPQLNSFLVSKHDVAAFTLETPSPHFVHFQTNHSGEICRVLGKTPSHTPAAAGLYVFKSGRLLAGLVDTLLAKAVEGRELCMTDLFTGALMKGLSAASISLGTPGLTFFSFGDPALLKEFEKQQL
jgi:NDP-sugar pyrophosphorylase family protein